VSYVISIRQTTFWEFTAAHRTSRVHFHGKSEWHYSQELVPAFNVVEEHPLLLDYSAPWSGLYVSEAASDSATIVASIGGAARTLINDWRPASHYLNDGYPASDSIVSAPVAHWNP
jgi:hypothetical protein